MLVASPLSMLMRTTSGPLVLAGRSKASCVLLGAGVIGGISIAVETMKRLLESRSKVTVLVRLLAVMTALTRTALAGIPLT